MPIRLELLLLRRLSLSQQNARASSPADSRLSSVREIAPDRRKSFPCPKATMRARAGDAQAASPACRVPTPTAAAALLFFKIDLRSRNYWERTGRGFVMQFNNDARVYTGTVTNVKQLRNKTLYVCEYEDAETVQHTEEELRITLCGE